MIWIIVLAIIFFIAGDFIKDANMYPEDKWIPFGKILMWIAGLTVVVLMIFSIVHGILAL